MGGQKAKGGRGGKKGGRARSRSPGVAGDKEE